MRKYIFIICGTISLALGLLGIITPGLPTTPFILLTGFLYAKSSPKLYKKLEDNKVTGMYLKRLQNGLGWKARLASISLMWVMICITAFWVFEDGSTMRYVMLGLGGIGTIAQLIALRKRKPKVIVQEIEIEEEKENRYQ
ncbi:YbaN family protein [Dysgonomonas macrotermitis]|uniref:DUF454 domain-containing protein n=1 Tax=Dysgonomonas macrotermitis TaxID=1346286 RepID=A0A1M5DXQ1_9BACT|nr:YbaN family protein [Dysgonomonas macrotermitis]SHF71654.1 hypothetical protein SAMN05444362_10983 [Dysgonomonas macrotermitis]